MIEKVFAIHAPPAAIWRSLMADLSAGESGSYEVERRVQDEELSVWVQLQDGIRARVTYRLTPREDHTEVAATMEPRGLRYAFARMITFGRVNTNYEIVLVQALSNLKQAAESR